MKQTAAAIIALLATALTAAAQNVPPIWYTVEGNFQQAQELADQDFTQGAGVSLRYRIRSDRQNWDLTGLGARWEARSNATSTAAIQATATAVTNVTPNYFQITLNSDQTGSAVTNWPYAFVVTLGGVDYAIGTGTLNIPASAWTGASAIMTNITAASYTDAAVATHAGVIASAGTLGHVRIGARLSIDVDGILSADEQAGGGGNIEQIIEGSGITVTGGGGPTTTVAIATATLEAIDSAVQDDDAAFLAALTNATAGAGIALTRTGRSLDIVSTITQYTDSLVLAVVAADGYLKPNLAGGITLTGDVEAGSFTLDDVTITEWPAGGGTTDTNALDLAGTRPMTGDSVVLAREVMSREALSVSAYGAAFGDDTEASSFSAAFGQSTFAGTYGAVFGQNSVAGNYGFAAGNSGKGGPGSFVFADSTVADFPRTAYTNWFSVRAGGGTYFETPEFEVSGTNKAAAFSLDGVVITEWPEGGGGISATTGTNIAEAVAWDSYRVPYDLQATTATTTITRAMGNLIEVTLQANTVMALDAALITTNATTGVTLEVNRNLIYDIDWHSDHFLNGDLLDIPTNVVRVVNATKPRIDEKARLRQ